MKNFKNSITGETIDESAYHNLSSSQQRDFQEVDDDGNFLTSAIIGYATDNALIGGLLGGDITGGIIGDLLNDGDLF